MSSSCLKKALSALPDQVFCSRHPSEQLTCRSSCLCWPEKLILLIWLITHPWAEHHASPLLSQANDNSSSLPSQPFLPRVCTPSWQHSNHVSYPWDAMWAILEITVRPQPCNNRQATKPSCLHPMLLMLLHRHFRDPQLGCFPTRSTRPSLACHPPTLL